ncbi:MAG: BON domain-containing protein, partial [Sedimentisphaerales bacterium]
MSKRTQTVSRNRVRRVQSSVTRGMVFLVLAVASQPLWAQGKYVTDNEITTAVKTELRQDSAIPANRIDVETKDGIVILGGSVDNILAKERARRIAEAVVGVRSVINDINVKPAVARSDSELHSAVERALHGDPTTASYKVQARADDGIVTLTGTEDDWQEKQLCKVVAEGVKGVRDVKNDISVELKVHRSDAEIRQEIKDRLANDVRVDDALVKVAVHDGNVSLSGVVGSAQEKNRAEVDARVGGVENVNA